MIRSSPAARIGAIALLVNFGLLERMEQYPIALAHAVLAISLLRGWAHALRSPSQSVQKAAV